MRILSKEIFPKCNESLEISLFLRIIKVVEGLPNLLRVFREGLA